MTTDPATSIGGPLAGRTAIVTGASRGIGEAIVDAFLRAGASRVAAVARSADRLELLAKADKRVVPVVADLGVVADVEAAFGAAKEALGRIVGVRTEGRSVGEGGVRARSIRWWPD